MNLSNLSDADVGSVSFFFLPVSQAPSFGTFLYQRGLCYILSWLHKPKTAPGPCSLPPPEKLAGVVLTSACYCELSRGACTCLQAQEHGAVLVTLCRGGG